MLVAWEQAIEEGLLSHMPFRMSLPRISGWLSCENRDTGLHGFFVQSPFLGRMHLATNEYNGTSLCGGRIPFVYKNLEIDRRRMLPLCLPEVPG